MTDLINLILAHGGASTDYRIVIAGVNVFPLGVRLEVTHLKSKESAVLVVP
ncbi:hypothetical protein AB3R30_24645 [Leptolyngbyaceae cyanobacterium UHCC 1019]